MCWCEHSILPGGCHCSLVKLAGLQHPPWHTNCCAMSFVPCHAICPPCSQNSLLLALPKGFFYKCGEAWLPLFLVLLRLCQSLQHKLLAPGSCLGPPEVSLVQEIVLCSALECSVVDCAGTEAAILRGRMLVFIVIISWICFATSLWRTLLHKGYSCSILVLILRKIIVEIIRK